MSKEIELLEEIFELVSRSDPPRALLEDVLGKVLAFLDYQTGAVHLLDEEAGVFRLEAHRGVPDVLVERFREAPRQSRIIGHIIDEEKALFVKDAGEDPLIFEGRLKELGIHSFATVPIRARGRAIGVLSVASIDKPMRGTCELPLLAAVAHQLGVALDNSHLLARLRQERRLYRHLLDHAPDLTILCDPDFRIIRINQIGLRFFGSRSEETPRGGLEALVGEEAFTHFRRAKEKLVHGDQKGSLFEVHLRDPEGSPSVYEFQSSLVQEEEDRFFLHFVGRNLTKRKELEARLLDFTDGLAEMVERRTSQLQEAKNQIAYLFDVAMRIHQLGSMDERLRLIARSVLAAKLFRKVWIRVIGTDGRPLHEASEGFSEEELARVEERCDALHRPDESQGTIPIGASLFLPSSEDVGKNTQNWRKGDLLLVPLVGRRSSEPIGLLAVDDPWNGLRPTEETVQVMELFVTQGARALEEARIEQKLADVDRLRMEYTRQFEFVRLVGETPSMKDVLDRARRLARVRTSVLITGESGTGKELVAQAIHYNGPRREGPFLKVNCAAIAEPLLESELFGIEGRVATGVDERVGKFERADGGTLFLDEVADMSQATQAKVLRALQERAFERVGGTETIRVNVRIVAATNRDLQEEIDAGRFRRDLYYRLNVVSIHLPPLRDRRQDIPLLAEHFLTRSSRELGKPMKRVPEEVMDLFRRYPWPGNVRQLQNCIERAMVIGGDDEEAIQWKDLPPAIRLWEASASREALEDFNLSRALEKVERELLVEALKRSGWVQKRAAELLGITERSMGYRVRKMGIPMGGDGRDEPKLPFS